MATSNLSVKQSSLQYGYILGGILALITISLYALNPDLFLNIWIGIVSLLIVVAVGIVSTARAKSILGGFMTFKEAFTAYFIPIAVGLLISTVVGILVFVVLDPELSSYLNEQTIEMTRDWMARFGTPEAEIEKALSSMEGVDNFSVVNQLKSYLFRVIGFAVLGLLIALIFKSKDPNAID